MARAANPDDTMTIDLNGERVTVSVPPTADEDEAAAIATAIGAHLRDRAVAAAASDEDEASDRVSEWKLAGRLKSMGRHRYPSDVRRGDEWKAAARSFYR